MWFPLRGLLKREKRKNYAEKKTTQQSILTDYHLMACDVYTVVKGTLVFWYYAFHNEVYLYSYDRVPSSVNKAIQYILSVADISWCACNCWFCFWINQSSGTCDGVCCCSVHCVRRQITINKCLQISVCLLPECTVRLCGPFAL